MVRDKKAILNLKRLWRPNTNLVKVFSFTAISTVVKILTGFISVKVVASIVGPSGVAMLGQLINFSTIVLTLASAGINNGVTKYIAEYNNSETQLLSQYVGLAFKITLCCSIVIGVVMMLASHKLAYEIMLDKRYRYLFIIFGCTIFLYALNNLFISIVNGFKDFKKYVYINITDSVVGLLFTLCLVHSWGLKGALVASVTYQSVMVIVTFLFIRNSSWFRSNLFTGIWRKDIVIKYLRYSAMTLISVITLPVVQMILRSYAIANFSASDAGLWEGMNRLSNMYLMIVSTSLSVYYLPRLSEISDPSELRSEVLSAFKFITPFIAVGLFAIYICRYWIVTLAFSKSFLGMTDLFIWHLFGDFFKIMSWLLAFLMVAKSMTKAFVLSEILVSLIYVGLGYFFISNKGIIGLNIAYMITYFFYLISMVLLFRKLFYDKVY